jgi:hypothetical protein
MKKAELIQKLEVVKDHSPVVSIDKVIELIQQLEETKIVTKTELRLTNTVFEKIMDIVVDAVDDLRDTQIVDLDSAEFEINYNNQVELTNIQVDRDVITDAIRDEIDRQFEILDDEEETPAAEAAPEE